MEPDELVNMNIVPGSNINMPQSFKNFLEENKIPLEFFSKSIEMQNENPRYIRLKPMAKITDEDISDNLKCKIENIPWIPQVYAIPGNIKILSSSYYQNGYLYGIDLSSAAVVEALDPKNDERILDLCCCPGAKLCFIADKMKSSEAAKSCEEEEKVDFNEAKKPKGSLTGVDINENRLKVCQSIIKKYGHSDFIELIQADGVTFKPKSDVLYDKVLVDVECTHEGSLKHLSKFTKIWQEKDDQNKRPLPVDENFDNINEANDKSYKKETSQKSENTKEKKLSKNEIKRRAKQKEENQKAKRSNSYLNEYKEANNWGINDFNERFLDPKKINNLEKLQRGLIRNAYDLTKVGGIFIYSTCSFIKAQNEDIVEEFLKEVNKNGEEKVKLIDVFESDKRVIIPCSEGFLEKTVRFDPIRSRSGGMFIAKMQKL